MGCRKTASGKYEITANLGEQPARRCTDNPRHVFWLADHRSPKCPKCTAPLASVIKLRRQIEKGGFRTIREATAWKQATETDSRRGETVLPGKLTVSDQIERFLTLKRAHLKPNTHKRYDELARLYLIPDLGSIPVHLVRPDDIDELWIKMAAGGSSTATIKQARSVLYGAFKSAKKNRLLTWNPVADTDVPHGTEYEREVVRPEVVQAVLTHMRDTRWALPALLAIFTGMRRSEVLGLRWSSVDLDAETITVRESLHAVRTGYRDDSGQWWAFQPTKTKTSKRPLPVAPSLARALRAHKVVQSEQRLAFGTAWTNLDLVCDRGDGLPLHPDNFTSASKRAVRAAGLSERIRLHDMRHAANTMLRAEGIPLDVIRDTLGHHSVAFTADHYGDVLPERLAAVAEAMERHYGIAD